MGSANVPFGSHGHLQPGESKPLLEALDRMHASFAATDETFPVPQAHSEILGCSVVDSTVGFGSFGVLSGVCLAYRLALEACTLLKNRISRSTELHVAPVTSLFREKGEY